MTIDMKQNIDDSQDRFTRMLAMDSLVSILLKYEDTAIELGLKPADADVETRVLKHTTKEAFRF